MTKTDRDLHCKKEKTRRAEHKKKKEAKHARQRNPWQANSHNQLTSVPCEAIAEEDEATQTLILLDEPGGQVARLLSTSHAKKSEPQVKETLLCKGKTWITNKHKQIMNKHRTL